MMIGGHTTYDSIPKRTTKEEDATGSIPWVQQQQQQDHAAARFLIEEEEMEATDGRRRLFLLFRRSTIQTRSVAAILVGIFVGASVLMALSATDRNGGISGMVAWRSSSSRTDNVVGVDKASTALVTVTWDESCMKEVPGAGPCCDGHPLYEECNQVCDWLLLCDKGYVPELTDDTATVFPETSDYQPHNCLCRGDIENYHDGCFCRQVRDMIIKFSNGGVTGGGCDPCLPPPTPSPTTLLSKLEEEQTCKVAGGVYLDDGRRNADTSKPFYLCFVVTEDAIPENTKLMLIPPTGDSLRGGLGAAKVGTHCWTESIQIHGVNVGCYPSGITRGKNSRITWSGTSGRGNDNCGDPCTEFDVNYPFDRYCTISKGVYKNEAEEGYECYQYKNTTKYCWTHHCPKCFDCEPHPYNEYGCDVWHRVAECEDEGYIKRSDLNSCGPPCTEFEYKHSNMDDDT